MERRNFFALLFGAFLAPFLKKRAEAKSVASEGWLPCDGSTYLRGDNTWQRFPSGYVVQWYGSRIPDGWMHLPDNYYVHAVVDPGHSHSSGPVWIKKL